MSETSTIQKHRLPLAPSLFLALALTFFMAFCAFSEVILARYMVVLVFVLLLFIAVRSRLVTVLSVIPCALAFLTAESSPAFALLLCVIAVIGYGGFAIASIHPILVLSLPVASCLLGFAITGDLVRALSTLILLPFALVAALTLRLKLSRTASIAVVSTALVAALLILLGASVLLHGGSLSPEGLSELISSVKNTMTAELSALSETVAASGLWAEALSEQDLLPLINSSLRLLPATLIVAIEILAYLGCLITVTLRTSQFPEEKLPAECRIFRMSVISAILFLLCAVLSLLPLGKNDTVGILLISALNLFLILTPGLALCGAVRIWISFRRRRSFPPFLLILFCFWFFSAIPMLLAFVGAFAILRSEKLPKRPRNP